MKRLLMVTAVFFLLFIPLSLTHAQNQATSVQSYPIPIQPSLKPGQSQYYTVTFRGNGEAVVSAKIIVTNDKDTPQKSIILRVPKVTPSDISAYQLIREPTCIRYKSAPPFSTQQNCDQYAPADYSQPWWGGNTRYQKATTQLTSDTLTITLPNEITPTMSGSVIVYYRSLGYAKRNAWGLYRYAFETLKVQDFIQTVQIGISTDEDLFLRGTKGKINYQINDPFTMMKSAQGVPASEASARFSRFYDQIGQGSIVKTVSNLQPLDSYTMKGSYADSVIKLYGVEIALGILALIASIGFFIHIVRYLARSFRVNTAKTDTSISSLHTSDIIVDFVLSFLVSLLIFGYTLVLYVITKNLNQLIPYDMVIIVLIMLFIISFAVYGFLLFVPSIFVGIKRGIGHGISIIGLTIGWLVIYLLISLLVILLNNSGFSRGPMNPLIRKAILNTTIPETSVAPAVEGTLTK